MYSDSPAPCRKTNYPNPVSIAFAYSLIMNIAPLKILTQQKTKDRLVIEHHRIELFLQAFFFLTVLASIGFLFTQETEFVCTEQPMLMMILEGFVTVIVSLILATAHLTAMSSAMKDRNDRLEFNTELVTWHDNETGTHTISFSDLKRIEPIIERRQDKDKVYTTVKGLAFIKEEERTELKLERLGFDSLEGDIVESCKAFAPDLFTQPPEQSTSSVQTPSQEDDANTSST